MHTWSTATVYLFKLGAQHTHQSLAPHNSETRSTAFNQYKQMASRKASFFLAFFSPSLSLSGRVHATHWAYLALECAQQTNDSAGCYWQTRHLAFVLCLGWKEAVPLFSLPRIFSQRGQCWFLINFQLGVLPFNCADEKKERICCWLSFVPRASGRRSARWFISICTKSPVCFFSDAQFLRRHECEFD